MSIPVDFLSEEQFSCSICLDVFSNPVSTPCGHSFCLACISFYWDSQSKACICPMCKESFRKRPELHINHTLKEITEQFKRMAESSVGVSRTPRFAPQSTQVLSTLERKPNGQLRPGELPGGLLLEMKNRFQRTMSSGDVLEAPPPPPPSVESQRRSLSTSGCSNSGSSADGFSAIRFSPTPSSGPQCSKHGLSLERFCKNDQVCVCAKCAEDEHHGHTVVVAMREMNIKKSQLGIMESEVQGLITVREKKIKDIQTSLADIQVNAQQEAEITVGMFRTLFNDLARSQAEVLEVVQMGRSASELRSQALIRDLQLEISELRKRSSTLSQLAQSTDQLSFFKMFPSLGSQPEMKNWTDVALTPEPTAGSVLRTVTQMAENVQEELRRLSQLCLRPPADPAFKYQPRLCNLHEFALDVTLDRDSAHPRLVISDDCKQVYCSDQYHSVSNTPNRFDRVVCVLGCQGFRSGRHYWEVQVGGKTDWDLGVVSRTINRKGKISVSPANGYWFLSLRDKYEYAFRTEPSISISLHPKPQKIGIYVDYERGQVSFYNADIMALIHTYMDSFPDVLFPFFSPCTNKSGKNDAPLIICPICPPG